MNQLKNIAFIGNSLPRRCGIATFTTDLQQAVSKSPARVATAIVAMTDHGHVYDYPPEVRLAIADNNLDDYIHAADVLNAGNFDVACLQHEFGIFGGEDGDHIVALLSRLKMPIVTTLHTVLAEPSLGQRRVLNKLVDLSAKVVVMAEKGRTLLSEVYHVPADKIEVVPHGIPDMPFSEPAVAKAGLGFDGRSVILTFGLLSPNKGIEVMIDAMPLILENRPDAIYVILGATHPNLVRDQGEAYRESLVTRVNDLGIEDSVVLLDRFVDKATLLEFISMCDVYATPYLNAAQMTSGTLAYSFGLGKAVVSTPYWHAQELLAEGRGVLVPFGDESAIGREIASLLTDDARRDAMRRHAYQISRPMTWQRAAERYLALFSQVASENPACQPATRKNIVMRRAPALPEPQLGYFMSMCDDTGLFQHAVYSVPDRAHGYCVDDNARALLLSVSLNGPGERLLPEALTARFASFVQHAWNPDEKHFRNFMGFDRRWLEDKGSEDSHGRTLWALGECARGDASPSRRAWAAALFAQALPTVEGFGSPRAWAFALLGLDGYCAASTHDMLAHRIRLTLADRLMDIFHRVERMGWNWFEENLSYDNARLSQALIATGWSAERPDCVAAGLKSLRWLMTIQTSPEGLFRPIGTDGFTDRTGEVKLFDQQPLEATATIAACHAAWRVSHDTTWKEEAAKAFAWFLGSNDLSLPVVDLETGSCRDGLHPTRRNENRGGESVVCYLLGLVEFRKLSRASGHLSTFDQRRALTA
ncbi:MULTISPECIES: glycosyltransferase family 4 protein [Rhizobium]|uniref:Glycosyltransferase involved in cell wall biosynthesis n=1 Tax=Rhizobium metallidurans TaxID=1265931 RepID=A0A7W6CTN3_9HYPH|nr:MULTISPECIES: glycosyltransferase family 4 protein [Rhizobium]MBB3966977.1 glycosyltransferase involved in cell wall biosynthesis [Rhizobium metallidurans]